MLFHHCIILWMFRHPSKQPYRLKTPVIEWMEFWCSCNLKCESNPHCGHDLAAYTVLSLVLMGLIKNPKPPSTVCELAIAWRFRSGSQGIIWNQVDILSVFRLVNTGVQIILVEIRIFRIQQVHQFEISSICYLLDDSIECLCYSRHCDHQDWFKGWCKCWMPQMWSCLDLWKAAGH